MLVHVAFEPSEKQTPRWNYTCEGIRPGRELEEVGEPPEHNVGLIPGKERGKADRVRGRRSLRLQPSYKNVCSQAGGEPLSQNLP